jgi:hypothetical protein
MPSRIKDEFRSRSDIKIGDLLNCEALPSGYVRITHGDFIDRVFHLRELLPVLNAAIVQHNDFADGTAATFSDGTAPTWGPSVLGAVIPLQLAAREY